MGFGNDIQRFADKTGLSAELVLRKLALQAYEGVLKRSPVDTGRFRASNRLSINRADLTVEPADAISTTFETTAMSTADGAKIGDVVIISNNLPYAEPLENGHSSQAPQGVYSLTFQELKADFRKVVREVSKL